MQKFQVRKSTHDNKWRVWQTVDAGRLGMTDADGDPLIGPIDVVVGVFDTRGKAYNWHKSQVQRST